MSPLLEARSVERRLGSRVVVRLDELRLERGEVVAVLGPNGAGKSTLLRLLLGLQAADAGELRLDGRAVRADDLELRRRTAATLQQPTLFSGTVRGNVEFGLRARRVDRRGAEAAAARAMEGMGIAHLADSDVRRLSGGEAQRVAVARALAVAPDILGLDEPTVGMDVGARREFRQRLERTTREFAGATLLVTHDAADAFALADRVLVLEDGRLTQAGPPEALVAAPLTAFVAAFTGAELLLDGVVHAVDGATVTVRTGERRLEATPGADRIAHGERVHLAYRPEDILLMGGGHDGPMSARNRLELTVAAVTPVGGLLRVRLEPEPALVALVTRAAADELGIRPGARMTAVLKATALRAFPAPAAP